MALGDDLPSLPCPIGQSGFRSKGTLYLGTRTFFEKHHARGLNAVLDELPPGPLREFIAQPFLAGGWYDALPIAPLIRAEARALRLTVPAYMRQRTRWQLEQDVSGVFRFLLKLASVETILSRVVRFTAQYQDFSPLLLEREGEHQIRLRRLGFPRILEEWWTLAMDTYTPGLLHSSGARNCTVHFAPATPSPAAGAVETVNLAWDTRWE